MKNKQWIISTFKFLSVASAVAVFLLGAQIKVVKASEDKTKQMHKMPEINPPAEFNQLKNLVGNWKGTQETPEGTREVVVEYHLTSAGTALVEKIFPGTEHEMLSVYHGDGDKVVMTHYCAFGNQPRMKMAKTGDSKVIKFDFLDGSNSGDSHMHQLTLKWVGSNHLKHEWVFHQNGKPAHTAKFDLRRTAR
jgi:hypothetical protein